MTTPSHQNSALILVADDDKFTRVMLRQLMEKEGYKVEEVENGEQCIVAYTHLKPDIILLDAMMPVMDGFTCCTHLQTLPGGASTPVLMITGLHDQTSVNCAFEAGATDFITKPIYPPVLCQRVRRILQASWAEKALQESEKQYRSVVENVKDVIFQANFYGELTFLNTAWSNLTEFLKEESIATHLMDYIHPEDQQLYQKFLHQIRNHQPTSFEHEIRYLTKTGECRWIAMKAHVTLAIDGTFNSISGILQDITERHKTAVLETEKARLKAEVKEQKRTAEVMSKALKQEKELAELRSRIITRISHEFRTPLTTILSSNELLENYGYQWSDEKKLKHFQRIQQSVLHMTQLLEDVMLMDQAESGQLQFNPTPLNLEILSRNIVDSFQENLEEKYQLNCSINCTLKLVNLDQNLIQKILINLLSNAIKYSPEGGTINFELFCHPDQAIFQIQDEGIGIYSEEQNRLFESFYRARNTENIKGTGLGLAIAKKCVDLHQGTITVKSALGVGTTVIVVLPFNQKIA